MSCLHTISKSPASGLLESCIAILKPGDAIHFIEDGIYYSDRANLLENIGKNISLHCQREDVIARGFLSKVNENISVVSYAKFVDLCVRHDKVVSWF